VDNLKINISIILPTINEGKNLLNLIPDIYKTTNNIRKINFCEVIVVDDGSTDDTQDILTKLTKVHTSIKYIKRKNKASLPLSIWDGIDISNQEYVMWLDADGSMTTKGINAMLDELINEKSKVVIGSRFVQNGGYKGIQSNSTNFFSAIKNVYQSEDSVLAVSLSKIFNNIIRLFINCGIKDVTSGFIVGKREYFSLSQFQYASYGDYFIYLIRDLKLKNISMVEVGYICETRKSGTSKSGTTFFILLKRALPYFKAAFKVIK
jgi:glycosyltransferase involved in cell wall biosynthesis